MKDTQKRLSPTTVALHWIVGIGIIVLLGVGLYMTETKTHSMYPPHKSFGMLIFVFVLWRVIWRTMNGWPQPAARYQPWEHKLARVVQWVLLIGTVLFPISGMVMSAMGGNGLSLFGLELFATNPNPLVPGKNMPINKELAGMARNMHGVLAWVMLAAIALHLAGALKHRFIDKDDTVPRMLGKPLA